MGVKCEIKFEQNPHGVFYAGQVMSGAVQISMDKARKFKGWLFLPLHARILPVSMVSKPCATTLCEKCSIYLCDDHQPVVVVVFPLSYPHPIYFYNPLSIRCSID